MSNTSKHYDRVREFMLKAGQSCPDKPTYPEGDIRELRAALILEEAFETVAALKVDVAISGKFASDSCRILWTDDPPLIKITGVALPSDNLKESMLVELIDGCIDTQIVTTGTLIAAGIPDKPFIKLIDKNNLTKVRGKLTFNGKGKLLKPKGFVGPNIERTLHRLQTLTTHTI